MFQLNVNQELVKKSARASYELAKRVCDDDVYSNITETGMEILTENWYKAKQNIINNLFEGKTSVEEIIEAPLESDEVEALVREFILKLQNGKFTYKREAYQMKLVLPNHVSSDAIFYLYRLLIRDNVLPLLGENIMTETIVYNPTFTALATLLDLSPKKILGMKISKFFIMFLKEIMKKSSIEKTEEIKKLEMQEIDIISQDFSQLINTLKTAKRKQTVVLSCALEDFMSMSYGNGWESCHRLGGMYGQGCIAYALSENVLIAYVKNEDDKFMKNWRQVVYCDEETGFAIGSRQYPSTNENAAKTARNLWQKCYNRKIGNEYTTDGFKFSKNSSGLNQYLTTYSDFAYIDIHHFSDSDYRIQGNVWSTWHPSHGKNEMNVCDDEIICPDCGKWHNVRIEDGITCAECSGEKYYCEHCETYHDEDDVRYVESVDGYVCDDCLGENFYYCEYCNEYHHFEHCTWVESVDESVCDDCLERNFTKCEDCGEYFLSDELTSVDGGKFEVCSDCLSCYSYCDDCGEYFSETTGVDKYEKYVCDDCLLSDDYTKCEECGEYFSNSEMKNTDDEKYLCEDCYEDYEEEDEE